MLLGRQAKYFQSILQGNKWKDIGEKLQRLGRGRDSFIAQIINSDDGRLTEFKTSVRKGESSDTEKFGQRAKVGFNQFENV